MWGSEGGNKGFRRVLGRGWWILTLGGFYSDYGWEDMYETF